MLFKEDRLKNRLLKGAANIGSMTLVSRILGFVRDVVLANLFGSSAGADAFFVAFKIPNFLRRLFGEGAFSQAFVPVLSETKSVQGEQAVKELVNHVTGVFGLILFAVTLIGVIAAPLIIIAFAPGFIDEPAKFDLAVQMLRITFPYLLFISLVALAGGILNTYGHFTVPAITPVLLNLSLIGAAILLAPRMTQPIVALAWGVFIGGVVQLLFQLPALWRIKHLPIPIPKWRDPGVKKIFKLMIPALFGVSVAQINLLLDTLLASFLVTGSISWLYYSDRLMEFPIGILGVAVGTVILPRLSKDHALTEPQAFSDTLSWALKLILVAGMPACVMLILLAAPMLSTLFQYGAFSVDDVVKASMSLQAYSLGLFGFLAVKVLAPGYYARQDTKTPVRVGIIAMVANMILNLILIWPLQHVGLAMATAGAALLNASLLWRGLRTEGVIQPGVGWRKFILKVSLAALMMAGFLIWQTPDLVSWHQWPASDRALRLSWLLFGGAVIYLAMLWISGVRRTDF